MPSDALGYGSAIVYDGKMWLIGGWDDATITRNVYYSTDGATWTAAGTNALPTTLAGGVVMVYGGKMWFIGGFNGATYSRRVYYSTDGATWTEAGTNALPQDITSPGGVVFNGKMWLIGGCVNGCTVTSRKVYSSTDGVTWTEAGTDALPIANNALAALVYSNKMWVIGGASALGDSRKVWSSSDGITWTEAGTNALPLGLESDATPGAVVYDGKMWIVGGWSIDHTSQKALYSSDGVTWTEAGTNALPVAISGQPTLVYNGRIWVLGGYATDHYTHKVYYSAPTVRGGLTVSSNSNSSLFTVLNNGNVGIGTTSPDQALTVSGSFVAADILDPSNSGSSDLSIRTGSDQSNFIELDHYGSSSSNNSTFLDLNSAGILRTGSTATGGLNFVVQASAPIRFATGGFALTNERMRITETGNIGIGTTSPWRTLSVAGTISASGLTGSSGAGSLCLTANKEVVYNSGSDSCLPSLRSLKHDISSLTLSGTSTITALDPVSFIYNYDASSTVRYGFIAEDTSKVDEHLGTYDANGNLSGVDDRSLIAVLVKAVKEMLTTMDGFAESFTSKTITASNELCVGSTCINEAQFKALVGQNSTPAITSSASADPTPTNTSTTTSTIDATTTPSTTVDTTTSSTTNVVATSTPSMSTDTSTPVSVDATSTTTTDASTTTATN